MPPKKKTKPRKPAAKAKAAPRKAPKAKAKAVAKATAPVAAPAKPREQVSIAKAKGRPMLSWVGKRPLRAVTAFPAQLVETFSPKGADKIPVADASIWKDWPAQYPKGGLLFHGDNKEVLAHLLANGFRGKVQLIYIDPPFDSGADYVRKVSLRGPAGTTKLDGEAYSLGEQIQYTDIWAKDNFLQFIYEKMQLLKELLSDTGSIFVHLDPTKVHYVKVIMDEVFGSDGFRNEIVWRNNNAHNSATEQFGPIHQNILYYTKSDKFTLHPGLRPFTAGYIKDRFKYSDKRGIYQPNYITGPGLRNGESGSSWNGFNPSANGRHWAIPNSVKELLPKKGEGLSTLQLLDALDHADLIIKPKKHGGQPMYKQYMTDGVLFQDLWAYQPNTAGVLYESDECIDDDVKWLEQEDEMTGYPTQKPEGLIARIIGSCSEPSDLIFDGFLGSGTTISVAQKMGRRWIGCDINKGAIQTTCKRMHSIIGAQIEAIKTKASLLPGIDSPAAQSPCAAQLSFEVLCVNNYNMQIQHNEAVNLACEHIGVTRTLADSFFDGTQGKKLVKIIPFGHPLSPADLEEVKTELEARPTESRDVVVVCLGKEMTVDPWLADWNRMRKQGDTPNKIEVIELRSDPKYGKFIAHKPAAARVDIRREKAKGGDKILVEITDFLSPSIVERLKDTGGVLAPKITDWRAMVDSVMIDPAHDGKVFNIALADVPARKQDYVQGKYELPAPAAKTTVAVKVTDMLGEEVVITKEV